MFAKEWTLLQTAGLPASSSHRSQKTGASCRQAGFQREEGVALSMLSSYFNLANQVTLSLERSGQGMERGQDVTSKVPPCGKRGVRKESHQESHIQMLGGDADETLFK